MEENRTFWPLEEPLNPQIKASVWGGVAVIGPYVLVALIASIGRDFALETIIALAAVLVVCVGALLLLLWFCNRARLVMDEQGVLTRSVLGKVSLLDWTQLRTAAIIKLGGNEMYHWIVLSVNEPAEVISRKRMVWKNPKRDQELRIPFTPKRRATVEHYLGKVLPEIKL